VILIRLKKIPGKTITNLEKQLYITCNNFIFEFDGTTLKKVFSGNGPIISLSKDLDDNLGLDIRVWEPNAIRPLL